MIKIKAGLATDGHDRRTFRVHEDYIQFYSSFEWEWTQEDGISVLTLEEDADTVHEFVTWLYTQTVSKLSADTAIDLWIFADHYKTPLLKNDSIDALNLFIVNNASLPLHRLHDIYADGIEDSARRDMITNAMSFYLDVKSVCEVEQWPKEAISDTLKSMVAARSDNAFPGPDYKSQDMCPHFHDHDDELMCSEDEDEDSER